MPGDTAFHPVIALRALRALFRSRGQDRTQAVIFLRALEGRSRLRAYARFCGTATGQRLLRDRPSLLDLLVATESDNRFPPGTLGYGLHGYMSNHGLTTGGVMEIAATDMDQPWPADEAFFEERSRAMHDLWHVATGYGVDEFGEICLMVFRCAQLPHLGFSLLTLGALVKSARALPGQPVWRAALEAWRIGKAAAWLRATDWEALLPLPLETVRARLNLRPPVIYRGIMHAAPSHGGATDDALAAA
jgi:ubiquinone biosynthesis protein COQ4